MIAAYAAITAKRWQISFGALTCRASGWRTVGRCRRSRCWLCGRCCCGRCCWLCGRRSCRRRRRRSENGCRWTRCFIFH